MGSWVISNKKGFTLTEMVMAIAIMGLLAAVALPNFINIGDDARIAVTKDRLNALKRAIVGDSRAVAGTNYAFPGFYADVGRLPATLSELIAQGAMPTYDPVNHIGWRGPYVDTSAVAVYNSDAWGTTIVYSTSPRFVRSWGPNKVDNAGAGDDISLTY